MKYTFENPKGIDYAIQNVQNYLDRYLGWDNIDIYGRVYKNLSKDGNVFPEAYIGKGEHREVLTNDKKDATIFFIDNDDHTSTTGHDFNAEVSIVFIVNLSRLYPNSTHRPDTESQLHVEKIIKQSRAFNVTSNTPLTISKGLENVLSDFDTSYIKLTDFQPYHIFSVKGTMNYLINNC